MDFKSQIATTRDQSEILLSLGLKPETADMVYQESQNWKALSINTRTAP